MICRESDDKMNRRKISFPAKGEYRMKEKNIVLRFLLYVLGLSIIAVGINFSKMAGLGISPVSSVPRALEIIWGYTLGKMVILSYCVLVLAQLAVLRKNFRPVNCLGVLVGVVFGSIVDFVGIDPNAKGHLLLAFPRPESYPMRLVYLAGSILIIGVGVYIYLKPGLTPMPSEGLAQAIADVSGKAFGDCKTMVDTSMIALAFLLQFIFLGGFDSLTGAAVVVREGTLISALSVGQVVKLLKKSFG